MQGHQIEGFGRERQLGDVRLADLTVAQPGTVQVGAGHGQHLAGQVDPLGMVRASGQQFKNTAGAGAQIQVAFDGFGGKVEDRLFDHGIVDVERAQLVPPSRVFTEIALCFFGPLALDLHQALAVAGQDFVVERGKVDQAGRQIRLRAVLGEAVEHPAAFRHAGQQPGGGQHLEVAGNARLALAQDADQFGYRQFAVGTKRQNAKAGRFRRRAHAGHGVIQGSHRPSYTYKDIFMSIGKPGVAIFCARLTMGRRKPPTAIPRCGILRGRRRTL